MSKPAGQLFRRSEVATMLHAIMQADSLDAFVESFEQFLRRTLPHHSLCVSFNDLEYFSPALIRDTKLSERCDLAYMTDRYVNFDPTPGFLRKHVGIAQSTLEDHLDFMPPVKKTLYRERFMQHEGWDKYAEIYFWNGDRLGAVICIRRAREHRNFSAEELRFLGDLRDMLRGCVERLQRQHRQLMAASSLHEVILKMPVPLIVLDWSLRPFCFNPEARRLCVEWSDGEQAARTMKSSYEPAVPEEILRACAERKQALIAAGSEPAALERFEPRFLSIVHPSRPELSAQVESIHDASKTGWPDFLVRLHKLAPPRLNETSELTGTSRSLAPLACLSRCERDIVLLLRRGLSNREIAANLRKSESTVKMQLHSVFRKLRVSRRTQLMAMID